MLRQFDRLHKIRDTPGKHESINARSATFYKNFLLPEGIQLIYASSDTGTDVPNQLIKKCDKASRDLAKVISLGEFVLPSPLGGGTDDFAGCAYVNITSSPFQFRSYGSDG